MGCQCSLAGRCSHGRALCRYLSSTQVSGDVSGWKAMTQATHMCVQQRRHGACVGALCVLGGRIGAHRGEGAAQMAGRHPCERRRLGLGGDDAGYCDVRTLAMPAVCLPAHGLGGQLVG